MSLDESKKLDDFLKVISRQIPVTCIKFLDKYVLGGVGGDLYVYESQVSGHFQKTSIVNVFSSSAVHGIIVNSSKIFVFGGKNVAYIETNDNFSHSLIKSSSVVEDWILDIVWTSEYELALLTAHNVLLLYHCFSGVISRLCCTEQCILYSGKILNSKWEELIVLSGTVYQEVIIWSSDLSESQGCPVIQRLKGHKGVIFSITYDNETQRICSTSDDRTVRVWSVKFPNKEFSIENWIHAEINLSFSVFGHTARVWRGLFVPGGQLISVGEDSQICLWDERGELVNRWEHSGEIWCLDYNNFKIVVGGNGIIIRSIMPLPQVSSVKLSEHYGMVRNAVLNTDGSKIIITDKGNLILFTNEVVDVLLDQRFHNYCILSISPCRNYIILGGINGDIALFEVLENKFSELFKVNVTGRIYALTWASSEMFVSSGVEGLLKVWKLMQKPAGTMSLQCISDFTLPQSKERWITCALSFDNYLLCGDRMGSVHLYSFLSSSKDPSCSIRKLHDVKGVSDVKHIGGILYSIGRDGTLRELIVSDNKLVLLAILKLPMDWATSVISSKNYGLIIAGFFGPNFILWSVEERITLLQLDCGGGHRSFDCLIDENNGILLISFIRMKELKFLSCTMDQVSHQTVLAGYHTKTINCSCLLPSKEGSACIITGSEDNSIRICKIDQSEWKCHSTYSRHISSIRVIDKLDDILVTAGGRAQIILWHVQDSSGEIKLKEIDSHMLREESEHRRSWKNAEPLIDPETRYMDLKIVKIREGSYKVFSCCSDGMLRIFNYDTTENKLQLVESLESNQGCLLKISIFFWHEEPIIVSGGTKGTVVFWYAPFEDMPNHYHTLHSSGINSMDLIIEKNHLILCTGGDDTDIVFSAFSLEKERKENIIFSAKEHFHYCQITGLKIHSDYIISIALDRQLCVTNWSFDGIYIKTSLLYQFTTSVFDNHGLLVFPAGKEDQLKIFVFGRGFELLNFDRKGISSSRKL